MNSTMTWCRSAGKFLELRPRRVLGPCESMCLDGSPCARVIACKAFRIQSEPTSSDAIRCTRVNALRAVFLISQHRNQRTYMAVAAIENARHPNLALRMHCRLSSHGVEHGLVSVSPGGLSDSKLGFGKPDMQTYAVPNSLLIAPTSARSLGVPCSCSMLSHACVS